MEVIVRVDASATIGHGHLSRCLALADALKHRGWSSTFVMRHWSRPAASRVEAAGHSARFLDASSERRQRGNKWLDVSWEVDARQTLEVVDDASVRCVVVDQYGLDERWERFVSEQMGTLVVVIDGLAAHRHDCDLLVDPTYHCSSGEQRWHSLVPKETVVLAGPRYAMLRPEFEEALAVRQERDGRVEEILVAFGGSDAAGATELAVEAVSPLAGEGVRTTVVAGASKPDIDGLRTLCAEREGVELVVDTDEMARLMVSADLAIGGAGTMTWERAFVGLPAIVIAIADHQRGVARPVADAGAIRYLGAIGEVDASQLCAVVETLRANPAQVRAMARRSRRLMGDDDEVGTVKVARQLATRIKYSQKGE